MQNKTIPLKKPFIELKSSDSSAQSCESGYGHNYGYKLPMARGQYYEAFYRLLITPVEPSNSHVKHYVDARGIQHMAYGIDPYSCSNFYNIDYRS